jgi:hypothetical protein
MYLVLIGNKEKARKVGEFCCDEDYFGCVVVYIN